MNAPNPALMELYGTDEYYLEKVGFLPPAALKVLREMAEKAVGYASSQGGQKVLGQAGRAAGGLGFLSLVASDQKHQENLVQEAALMNEAFRHAEAHRMSDVVSSFGGPGSEYAGTLEPLDIQYPVDPMMMALEQDIDREKQSSALDPELVKFAEAWGRSLAHQEMDKEALGALLGGLKTLGGKAVHFAGKALSGAGKGLSKSTSTGRMLEEGAEAVGKAPITQRVGQAVASKGSKLKDTGAAMQEVGHKASLPKWEKAVDTAGGVGEAAETIKAPKGTPAGAGTVQNIPAGDPTPPAPTAAAPKKPLISPMTKAKIGLGVAGTAAGAGALYGGYKGLQAARDYMMMPSTTGGRWGGYGPQPVHSVNRYGYVPPNF